MGKTRLSSRKQLVQNEVGCMLKTFYNNLESIQGNQLKPTWDQEKKHLRTAGFRVKKQTQKKQRGSQTDVGNNVQQDFLKNGVQHQRTLREQMSREKAKTKIDMYNGHPKSYIRTMNSVLPL